MSKKINKSFKVDNFTTFSPQAISIDVHILRDDNSGTIYNASLMFHLKTEQDGEDYVTSEALAIQTNIFLEDLDETIKAAARLSVEFFTDELFSKVSVFDDGGNLLEEIDLNRIFDDEEVNKPVSAEYNLEDMPAGVPLIRH